MARVLNWYQKNQRNLDLADYWARVTWLQMMPIHLPPISYRQIAVRFAPWLTEQRQLAYPYWACCHFPPQFFCRHFAMRKARMFAWDAKNVWAKKPKPKLQIRIPDDE